jgi:type III pantothenate kinase
LVLLFDIGNTNTHLGVADERRVVRQTNIPTASWFQGRAAHLVARFATRAQLDGVALCSVVPKATPLVRRFALRQLKLAPLELTAKTVRGVGIDYPKPETIGADRLANSIAVKHHFGAPTVVVDFGTAVTFDVVNRDGNYTGGIIAPGLAAMTDYLHEKTALLPKVKIREPKAVVGKSTHEAMLVGTVYGYRALIRGLLAELKRELKSRRLPVVATGSYAELIAEKTPEITAIEPSLTLEGLRLVWLAHHGGERFVR